MRPLAAFVTLALAALLAGTAADARKRDRYQDRWGET
jgi:hypothetical protein